MTQFHNSYYLMRHGQSIANVERLIISDPAIGCTAYGLTDLGQQQVIDAAESIKHQKLTHIISSDFLRTKQTAELIANHLGISAPILEPGLRERNFGDLQGNSDQHYQSVWQRDKNQQPHQQNIESVESVLKRGLGVLKQLEANHQNNTFLLVSHGDLIQILQTAFAKIQPHQHRDLAHHHPAEIKMLAGVGDVMFFD